MSELPQTTGTSPSPGQLIRSAREASGLHIVALAAALKVPVRKLEALEADRWEELTDPTFTRALASSVARHLKVDSTAVLNGLPTSSKDALEISAGLGQAASTGRWPSDSFKSGSPGIVWALVMLVLAVGVYLWPSDWLPSIQKDGAAVTPTTTSSSPPMATGEATSVAIPMGQSASPAAESPTGQSASAVSPLPQVTSPVPPSSVPAEPDPGKPGVPTLTGSALPVSQSPAGGAAPAGAGHLQLTLNGASWVEVTDSGGQVRLQRLAKAGEVLSFDAGAPFSVVLGNASAVEVRVNGQVRDLSDSTRNNVARFQVR